MIPFTVGPTGTVSESSALVHDGIFPEIREYDVDGMLRRIFRVPGFRRPVDREVEEGMIDYWMRRNGWSRGDTEWAFNEIATPDTLPVFQSLQVDEIGWIWAELYHWDRTKQSDRWMIFDPSRRAHGILQTPDGLQIQRIGEDFLLGVRFDELGVERVERYGLRRSPVSAHGSSPDQVPD